jgi:hypothetical protein
VFASAASAQIVGGFCLFVITVALSSTSLVGLNGGSNLLLYAPWVIDGTWALIASAGWAALVSTLIGAILWRGMRARLGVPCSLGLTVASVAVGGYAPWLLTSFPTARLGLSLLLTPAVVRLVAFDGSGQPRRLPACLDLPRRVRWAGLLYVALAVVAPYALLHPLAVHGSGESGGTFTSVDAGLLYQVRPGQPVQAEADLQAGVFPITVTGVRLVGLPQGLRVVRIALGSNVPLLRSARHGRFPVRVAARHSLWVGYAVALTHCPAQPVAITRLEISYHELGIPLTQTVPLAGFNTLLTCDT